MEIQLLLKCEAGLYWFSSLGFAEGPLRGRLFCHAAMSTPGRMHVREETATEGLGGSLKEGLESRLSASAVCVPLHCTWYTCSTTLVGVAWE